MQQRNQLLIRQQEAKGMLRKIHPPLQTLKAKVRELEKEYGKWWRIYVEAEEGLARERIKYIPMGRSGSRCADATEMAIRKFAAMPKKHQLKFLASLKKCGESQVHQVR